MERLDTHVSAARQPGKSGRFSFAVGDLVLIEWEDSYGCSPRWEDLGDGEAEPMTLACTSVGRVVRVGRRSVIVVPHLAESQTLGVRQGCGDMCIPLAAIVGVSLLAPRATASSRRRTTGAGRGPKPRPTSRSPKSSGSREVSRPSTHHFSTLPCGSSLVKAPRFSATQAIFLSPVSAAPTPAAIVPPGRADRGAA